MLRLFVRVLSGIRGQLVLLSLISCLPLAATFFHSLTDARAVEAEKTLEQLTTVTNQFAGELTTAGRTAEQLLRALSHNPSLARKEGRCDHLMAEIAISYNHYANLFSTDRLGNIICSASPLKQPTNVSDRDYFQWAMADLPPRFGEPIMGRITGKMVLPIGVPIHGSSDPEGAVVATVDLEWATRNAALSSNLREIVVTVLDEQGQVLARHPDPQGLTGQEVRQSELFRLLKSADKESGTAELKGLDGVTRDYAFTSFGAPAHRIWITSGIATASLFQHVESAFAHNVLTVLITTIASILIAWWIGELWVRRPLHRLAAAAEGLARGERQVAVELKGTGEIRELAHSFNSMVGALGRHEEERTHHQAELHRAKEELELKVAERTAQLEAASHEATLRARELEMRGHEVDVLNQMTDLLQSCKDLDEAYPIAHRALIALFPQKSGALFLFRESGNVLERVTGWGDMASSAFFSPDDCWALRLGHSFSNRQGTVIPVCPHASPSVHSYYCEPMSAQGKALGVLHISTGNGEEKEEEGSARRLARITADRLGLALANIKLRQQLKVLSIRDPLTGLYNRRFLEEAFEREVARAHRSNEALSVLMMDVDHFKRFNDTFGHEAGDLVLRIVGNLLQQAFRATDLPCRFGGEELIVVLPGSDERSAHERAELFRTTVERTEFVHQGKQLGSVTISIGVATFPHPIANPALLFEAADAALYKAKNMGRNQVVSAQTLEGLAAS